MEGPAHQRTFEVEVRFNDISLATGVGSSKRAAEEAAATTALERVRANPRMLDAMTPAEPDESVGE
jgi:dsRNA-specific ribonuclease